MEARIQMVVRQVIAAMGNPVSLPHTFKPPPSQVTLAIGPICLSAKSLEEAEAAQREEGLRILQLRKVHEDLATKEAKRAEERIRTFYAELQAKLQELAAAGGLTAPAFASQREKMTKENQVVAQQLQHLQ